MKNVTVDDASITDITLSPPACNGTGWIVNPERGLGGLGYRWCASPEGPKATFTFTGVAVYYSCPSFTGDYMQIVLDGGIPESVNLTSSQTPELRPNSSIVWFKTGLAYKQHTLELSPGDNTSRLSVDAFIYTTLEPQEIAALTASKPSPSSVSAQATVPERIANRAPIAVFSIIAFIVLSIFLVIAFRLWHSSRARRAQYSWKVPVPPLLDSQDHGASVAKPSDSIHLRGGESSFGHAGSMGHTQSITPFQSPPMSFGARPLPAGPVHTPGGESDDEVSSMQFYQKEAPLVAATDLRKPRRKMSASRGGSTYPPPPHSPVRTDTSYSSNATRLEPNRRARG